ncbi:hypothetical protein VP01_354g4 [Puccinia sorghi]|uniref:Uncharacterized protein n=1 Tax=Puccinia sorghi TaxID=27349 RepID=A0A0L6UVJ2_9BASI|nr:hypothetical protein VP01_354g4 [Puccinia sorghi]
MINYPNALQAPPHGATLPDRFITLTQQSNSVGGGSEPTGTVGRTTGNATSNTSTGGSATSQPTVDPSFSISKNNNTNSNNTLLLVDPQSIAALNISSSSSSEPVSNVGQHVLNSQGEVDGAAFGLAKSSPDDPANEGLSPGAKAGAIAGSLVTLFILLAIAFAAKKIHRQAKSPQRQILQPDDPYHSTSPSDQHSDYHSHTR